MTTKNTLIQDLIDGCYAEMPGDEPLFLLSPEDMLSPDLVREWAERYLVQHTLQFYPKNQKESVLLLTQLNPAIGENYKEALQLAEKMETWRKKNPNP